MSEIKSLDAHDYSAVVKSRKGKLQPDLVNSVALRNLPKETAEAEGWPTYYMPEPCANGHVAARFCKNSLCVDCWRVRQGREPIYPRAKDKTYYKQRAPAAAASAANGAPIVIAPPASAEPSKVEQKFLAALDESKDFDAAAAAAGLTRGTIESRASSSEVFRKALTDLCERRGIPWTRAPDSEFKWSKGVERHLITTYINTGLKREAWEAAGCTAAEFYARLEASPEFASAVEDAQMLAAGTLRERSLQAASTGNDRLLKIINDEAAEAKKNGGDQYDNMSVHQMHAQITHTLRRFDKQGLLTHPLRYFKHRATGQRIDLQDYLVDEVQPESVDDNSDLVSA